MTAQFTVHFRERSGWTVKGRGLKRQSGWVATFASRSHAEEYCLKLNADPKYAADLGVSAHGKLHLLIEPDPDGGYVGSCMEHPGAFGQGETVDEVVANTIDAITALSDTHEAS